MSYILYWKWKRSKNRVKNHDVKRRKLLKTFFLARYQRMHVCSWLFLNAEDFPPSHMKRWLKLHCVTTKAVVLFSLCKGQWIWGPERSSWACQTAAPAPLHCGISIPGPFMDTAFRSCRIQPCTPSPIPSRHQRAEHSAPFCFTHPRALCVL